MFVQFIKNCQFKLSRASGPCSLLAVSALTAILSAPLLLTAAHSDMKPQDTAPADKAMADTAPADTAQPESGKPAKAPADTAQPESAQPDTVEADTAGGGSIYSFKARALSGETIDLAKYKGQVLLIVNTASHCGFTPQYSGLEALYEKYGKQGFSLLGFPCNQFAGQEKGTAEEISTFCQKNYGVTFQMFAKIDVNGRDENPLYTFLKSQAPNDKSNIKWNFTKFLIGRSGKVFRRYGSMTKPESLTADIEQLLAQPASGD